jgi:hypothetical protein
MRDIFTYLTNICFIMSFVESIENMMSPGISLIGEPAFISSATTWPSLHLNMLDVSDFIQKT